MRSPAAWSFIVAVLLLPALAGGLPDRALPKRFTKAPFSLMSLTVGHPNAGWQVRAKRLKKSKHLVIKAGSEDNAYGHPALVLMLGRSAKELARAAPGSVLLVGDLSSKHGGSLSGHRSHQSGRDADVGFYALDAAGKPVLPEKFVAFTADGKATDGSGLTFDDRRNWLLVQSWVRDKRAGLSHIFVSRGLRQRMLGYATKQPAFQKYVTEVAALLKQPEDASPHDDHFHVRVSCPKDQSEICREESK
ncbi:MAG: penicillin-insensitive murein endopeptidase [Polyangiaceae bacterium]|nr:penicillin-insensitive murein endopeptidase [Polyangiaceae bacterium]